MAIIPHTVESQNPDTLETMNDSSAPLPYPHFYYPSQNGPSTPGVNADTFTIYREREGTSDSGLDRDLPTETLREDGPDEEENTGPQMIESFAIVEPRSEPQRASRTESDEEGHEDYRRYSQHNRKSLYPHLPELDGYHERPGRTPADVPIKASKGAPPTFKGKHYQVEDFLKHFERLCIQYNVLTDRMKCNLVPLYCTRKTARIIESLGGFLKKSWAQLKRDIEDCFDADRAESRVRFSDLQRFSEQMHRRACTNLSMWRDYYKNYLGIAGKLLRDGKIDERQFDAFLWGGIPTELRNTLENRIIAYRSGPSQMGEDFTAKEIKDAAEDYFRRWKFAGSLPGAANMGFDEEDVSSGSSDSSEETSDSDEDHRKKHRRKASKQKSRRKKSKGTVRFKETNSSKSDLETSKDKDSDKKELAKLVKDLERMSLSGLVTDPAYGATYYKTLSLDSSGDVKLCFPPPRNNPPPTPRPPTPPFRNVSYSSRPRPSFNQNTANPATFPNSLPVGNSPPKLGDSAGRPGCFGCHGSGHMMNECPELQEEVRKGNTRRDGRQYVGRDGQRIWRRRDESLVDAIRRSVTNTPAVNYYGNYDANLLTAGKTVEAYLHQDIAGPGDDKEYETDWTDFESTSEGEDVLMVEADNTHSMWRDAEMREYQIFSIQSEEDWPRMDADEILSLNADRTEKKTTSTRKQRMEVSKPSPGERHKLRMKKNSSNVQEQPSGETTDRIQHLPKSDSSPMGPINRPYKTRSAGPASTEHQDIDDPLHKRAPSGARTYNRETPPLTPFDARAPRKRVELPPLPSGKANEPTIPKGKRDEKDERSAQRAQIIPASGKGLGRQSELTTQVDIGKVLDSILDTPVPLAIRDILGSSRELSGKLSEQMRPRNSRNVGTRPEDSFNLSSRIHAQLIKIKVRYRGRDIEAVVDTGSMLNVVSPGIAKWMEGQEWVDEEAYVDMRTASGEVTRMNGYIQHVPFRCGKTTTHGNLWIGQTGVPYQLLLGRPWQRDNQISIQEDDSGTSLLIPNKQRPGRYLRLQVRNAKPDEMEKTRAEESSDGYEESPSEMHYASVVQTHTNPEHGPIGQARSQASAQQNDHDLIYHHAGVSKDLVESLVPELSLNPTPQFDSLFNVLLFFWSKYCQSLFERYLISTCDERDNDSFSQETKCVPLKSFPIRQVEGNNRVKEEQRNLLPTYKQERLKAMSKKYLSHFKDHHSFFTPTTLATFQAIPLLPATPRYMIPLSAGQNGNNTSKSESLPLLPHVQSLAGEISRLEHLNVTEIEDIHALEVPECFLLLNPDGLYDLQVIADAFRRRNLLRAGLANPFNQLHLSSPQTTLIERNASITNIAYNTFVGHNASIIVQDNITGLPCIHTGTFHLTIFDEQGPIPEIPWPTSAEVEATTSRATEEDILRILTSSGRTDLTRERADFVSRPNAAFVATKVAELLTGMRTPNPDMPLLSSSSRNTLPGSIQMPTLDTRKLFPLRDLTLAQLWHMRPGQPIQSIDRPSQQGEPSFVALCRDYETTIAPHPSFPDDFVSYPVRTGTTELLLGRSMEEDAEGHAPKKQEEEEPSKKGTSPIPRRDARNRLRDLNRVLAIRQIKPIPHKPQPLNSPVAGDPIIPDSIPSPSETLSSVNPTPGSSPFPDSDTKDTQTIDSPNVAGDTALPSPCSCTSFRVPTPLPNSVFASNPLPRALEQDLQEIEEEYFAQNELSENGIPLRSSLALAYDTINSDPPIHSQCPDQKGDVLALDIVHVHLPSQLPSPPARDHLRRPLSVPDVGDEATVDPRQLRPHASSPDLPSKTLHSPTSFLASPDDLPISIDGEDRATLSSANEIGSHCTFTDSGFYQSFHVDHQGCPEKGSEETASNDSAHPGTDAGIGRTGSPSPAETIRPNLESSLPFPSDQPYSDLDLSFSKIEDLQVDPQMTDVFRQPYLFRSDYFSCGEPDRPWYETRSVRCSIALYGLTRTLENNRLELERKIKEGVKHTRLSKTTSELTRDFQPSPPLSPSSTGSMPSLLSGSDSSYGEDLELLEEGLKALAAPPFLAPPYMREHPVGDYPIVPPYIIRADMLGVVPSDIVAYCCLVNIKEFVELVRTEEAAMQDDPATQDSRHLPLSLDAHSFGQHRWFFPQSRQTRWTYRVCILAELRRQLDPFLQNLLILVSKDHLKDELVIIERRREFLMSMPYTVSSQNPFLPPQQTHHLLNIAQLYLKRRPELSRELIRFTFLSVIDGEGIRTLRELGAFDHPTSFLFHLTTICEYSTEHQELETAAP